LGKFVIVIAAHSVVAEENPIKPPTLVPYSVNKAETGRDIGSVSLPLISRAKRLLRPVTSAYITTVPMNPPNPPETIRIDCRNLKDLYLA
jgi:hypothetical protein